MDKKLEQYFDQIPDWGDFEVLADEISGRIPVVKVAGWKQFTEALEDGFFNRPKTQLVFRGHRRYDWGLTPSLGRLDEAGIISLDLATAQFDLFKRAVRGRLADASLVDDGEEDELWSVGQHHGLMTPLLDWTYSPYVALFFAFVEDDLRHETDNPYRVLYMMNKSYIADDKVCPEIRILEPRKDEHGRLVNQAGLFSFSPFDNTIENALINSLEEDILADEDSEAQVLAQYICKIYIGNEDREGCLRHLRRMNVHYASLFPDLLGASDYCNILIEEDQREEAIEKERKKIEQQKDITKPVEDSSDIGDLPEVERLIQLLKEPEESKQVEPGRIELIANQLGRQLQKHKLVDWESREALQAKLRNITRVTLRNLGYPVTAREEVLEKIIEVLENAKDR